MSGRLLWKFQGAPTAEKLLGNQRLISRWPARGGPVIHRGVVYYSAGIWPFMGVFLYALDAPSGRLLWHNDRASAAYNDQPGATVSTFGGVSPQGALVVAGERLAVPSGRAWPAYVDLESGALYPHAAGIKDTAGGGDSQVAAAGDFLLMGGCVFSISQQRALLLNASTPTVKPFTTLSVVDRQVLYASGAGMIEAYDLATARLTKLAGAYGRPLSRCDAPLLWRLPVDERVEVMIKAGPRLYVAGVGWVRAVEPSADGREATARWRGTFAGTAGSLLAADGKLFVSTREGSIYCFGDPRGTARRFDRRPASPPAQDPATVARVRSLVEHSQANEGYAYVLGADEHFVAELVRQTRLHVVVIERDEGKCGRLRERLYTAGLYGERAAVLAGDATSLAPYLASLIVCTNPRAAGFASDQECAARLFEALRPYGGRLCLSFDPEAHAALRSRDLPGARVERAGVFTLVIREGALPGAADWAHEAADPGNTWMGLDRRVKAPLGVLWFGGPGDDPGLFMQRHADPPTARVCQGRIFVHGTGIVTALDAYTGRLLWRRNLPDVRAYQNLRSNVVAGPPFECVGDTTKRAALVAHRDGLYLAYGQTLYRWDPATGATRAEYRVPPRDAAQSDGGKEPLFLGDLRVEGDVLVLGAGFESEEVEAALVADDFREVPQERLAEMIRLAESWAGLKEVRRAAAGDRVDHLVQLGNQLLHDPQLAHRVPLPLRVQAGQDDTIVLESYRDKDAEFYGFDLRSGTLRKRISPLTGLEQPWGFHRMGGCTKNVCCPNLVLFRSQTAGYYDIQADGGTANLSGFRPGCKNSLIPADGLLNAPNYATGCTCNYPVFTSLALVHMPEVEQWTTNDYAYDGSRVERLGINLGAPGDRRAADGTLWLDFPSVGGPSPDVPVMAGPKNIRWFYRHSSRIRGSVPGWIVGSGAEGVENVDIRLCTKQQPPPVPLTYTVRLYFAECAHLGPGKRVFSVFLQGREVEHDLDVVRAAGAADMGLVKEYRGIPADDRLALRLVPKIGKTLLCGVELIAQQH